MITLTRLNETTVTVNSDLIETIETTPDTMLRLTTGQRLVVRETQDEIVQKVKRFRQAINERPLDLANREAK